MGSFVKCICNQRPKILISIAAFDLQEMSFGFQSPHDKEIVTVSAIFLNSATYIAILSLT